MISTSRLSDLFVEVADTLVDDFDVVDFLHRVTTSVAEITESSAVGLMLANHDGRLSFMAASTEDARLLELFQIQNSEGPCLDAHRTGRGDRRRLHRRCGAALARVRPARCESWASARHTASRCGCATT